MISVSVFDRGGLALVMLRDEGASLHTAESSHHKAYTARNFRQPSAAIVKRIPTSLLLPASRNIRAWLHLRAAYRSRPGSVSRVRPVRMTSAHTPESTRSPTS
ncbi:MAG: heme-binding protein [Pseudolabrys sp.]